jgi:CHAD domain-containing protein
MAPDEPVSLAVRRMTVDLLGRAVGDLRREGTGSFDKGIHGARKKMKRLRGLIRLVRDPIGHRVYREENAVLRDTARNLAGIRDALVLVETLRDIRTTYADLLDEVTFVKPEAWLARRHEERRESVTGAVVLGAVVNLATARARYLSFPIEEAVTDDFDAIARGVRRVYGRGHRGFGRAVATRRLEDLHEWRKRVKYLRYQMEALAPIQPTLIGSMAHELDELGEELGSDHDLAVLAETIMEHPESCRDERERWMLIALIHERRTGLQNGALRRGAALYAENPSAFLDRLEAYWQAGRR